jgi:hypothetical protein
MVTTPAVESATAAPGVSRLAVSGCSVSGTSILAIRMVPGAVMITAVSKCRASTPNAMYAPMMPPETCAMPAVMIVISSDRVISGRKGRMLSGASVWPMKIDAATSIDSAPLTPMIQVMNRASSLIRNGITRQ